MNQEKDKIKKWIDGRIAQGAYLQWLVDKHPEALDFKEIFIIARYTLGFRQRYAFIKSSIFQEKGIPDITKKRHIKKLKDMNLLEYHRTTRYTYYKLVLPDDIESKVLWVGKEEQKSLSGITREKYLKMEHEEQGAFRKEYIKAHGEESWFKLAENLNLNTW